MNDEQVMHAMCIDDLYHVDRTLAQGPGGVTELVRADGSGPFVRKKIPNRLARRRIWSMLADCDCPRLPHVVASYELPDSFVVVYDYVPGETLESLVAARGKIVKDQAVRLICQVCEALSALHALDIVHRDVTPANVIVAADGAHLVDLGIARIRNASATKDTTSLGTYGFASPEQFGFAQTDARSDVFSAGRLLGYMLTGVRPDEDDGKKYEMALGELAADAPGAYEAIRRACAFEPSARYQSIEEFARALGAPIEDRPVCGGGVQVEHKVSGSAEPSESRDERVSSISAGRQGRGGAFVVSLCVAAFAVIVICLGQWVVSQIVRAESGSENAADVLNEAREGEASSENADSLPESDSLATAVGDSVPSDAGGQYDAGDDGAEGNTAGGSDISADEFDGAGGAAGTVGTAGTSRLSAALDDADEATSERVASEQAAAVSVQSSGGNGAGVSASLETSSKTVVDDTVVDGLMLREAGWSYYDGYAHFAYEVENTSDTDIAQYPNVSVVGRAQDGSILFSAEDAMFSIYPGASGWQTGLVACTAEPAKVEFNLVGSQTGLSLSFSQVPEYTVSNVNVIGGDSVTRVTGEVTCMQVDDLNVSGQIWVVVVGRDENGEICEGETSAIAAPRLGQSAVFDVSVYTRRGDLTYEVHAGPR